MTRPRSDSVFALGSSALLASFTLFWFSHTIVDPDLWGHIRFGQDILRAGAIIQSDSYSYRTSGQSWINHEWLSELIFAAVYDRSGTSGLIVLKVAISLLLIGLSYVHLRHYTLGPLRSLLLLVLFAIPLRMGLGTIRPQLFTYLFFLIQLVVLERATAGRAEWLWLLPVLYSVWVNSHGGVLAGAGVLGIWAAVQAVERLADQTRPPARKLASAARLALLGLVCGLALLLNPYGAALLEFLLRTATVPRPEIGEWTPLGLMSLSGWFYLTLLTIAILGVVYSTRPRKPAAILILSVTAVLPLVSQRHYPLFLLTIVVLAGEHIADVWNRWLPPVSSAFGRGRLISALCIAVSLLFFGLAAPRFACIHIEPGYFAFPARAVALIKESGIRGNMAVPFEWGEYVLWQLGPRVKVSIDGRRETVYSDESYRQSIDFERGTGAWDSLLESATTDLVLVRIGSPTANLMSQKDGCVAVYRDSFSVLFVRAGFSSLDRIVETPIPAVTDNGAGLCFPDRGR
jgi:hypothetical protein